MLFVQKKCSYSKCAPQKCRMSKKKNVNSLASAKNVESPKIRQISSTKIIEFPKNIWTPINMWRIFLNLVKQMDRFRKTVDQNILASRCNHSYQKLWMEEKIRFNIYVLKPDFTSKYGYIKNKFVKRLGSQKCA